MGRKIAIVAKSATAGFAPFFDPEWEVWGMPWVTYPRTPDLLFDLHSTECWLPGRMMSREDQAKWEAEADATGAPIYCHPTRVARFKNGQPFPYDDVMELSPSRFFENTIAYQLAFAALQKPSEVALYGVNMMGTREYLWERASVLYWTGFLEGRGVKITTPPGSALFMSYWTQGRYGETADKRFAL